VGSSCPRLGRIRLRCGKWLFSEEQARGVEAQMLHMDNVTHVAVREANGSILVEYEGNARDAVLRAVRDLDVLALPTNDDRDGSDMSAIDNEFQMKLFKTVAVKFLRWLLLPKPLQITWTIFRSLEYLGKGVKALGQGKLSVEVLDATAIGVSMARGAFSTAGDVMFLLRISDILMDYTQARTRLALRNNLSLFAEHVWRIEG
jgi:cation transport ATPase